MNEQLPEPMLLGNAESADGGLPPTMKLSLPNLDRCGGRRIADSELVVCLAIPDGGCHFALLYGDTHYCCHSRRLEIAAHTRDLKRAKG
ncbi:MAG: hypothetical protein HZC54_13300 [Verrucomicrobia bacterium]|nr:hypothetical protein [Verrucomicrobiota bacterium]